jgi:hypothetical protein
MIGAAQWAISLGRFDIQTAIMSLSRYRVEPRIGHLERIKQLYGHLRRYKNVAIRVRTQKLDLSQHTMISQDWLYSVYGKVKEEIPHNIPEPLGNSVVSTHYGDANLLFDMITGRAVTGILHFLNETLVDWYSKCQATVETATYGSEFVAARIATNQIINIRTTLQYLGVPIDGPSHLFGDNASVIINSSIPHSSLEKRHNTLSYHRVREAIAILVMW